MKYSMVKQFSNAAIDNIFNVFNRTVDFFKLLLDTVLAFLEIWGAFFMIFWNFLIYIYYLFLFVIDRGTESTGPAFRLRRIPTARSRTPKVNVSNTPAPIPGAYMVSKSAETVSRTVSQATEAVASTVSSGSSGKSAGKVNIFKRVGEAIVDFFSAVWKGIVSIYRVPAGAVASFFENRLKPVREKEESGAEGKSLIDEYMKEYRKKKR